MTHQDAEHSSAPPPGAPAPPPITTHDGMPLPPDLDCFAPPPDEVGPVRTQWSNLSTAKPFGLLKALRGVKPQCSYVGELGVAQITGTTGGDVKKLKLFEFVDAVNLYTGETRQFYNGIYTGTTYFFRWMNEAGKKVFVLKGSYRAKDGNPKQKDPYWIGRSAEAGWSGFLAQVMQDELDRDGAVRFDVGGKNAVRVGPGFMTFAFKGKPEVRLDVEKVAELSINGGVFRVKSTDAKWHGSGKFSFGYKDMANAKLFLFALERLCGHQFGAD